MPRTVSRSGRGLSIIHCVERLALDILGDDIEEAALAQPRPRLQDVRTVDPPRDPFLEHEPALKVFRIIAQIHRRDLRERDGPRRSPRL